MSLKRVGLALGGGGARGLCHVEFLQVMDELEITPAVVSGTSIGSIIGAFYAAGLSGRQIKDLYGKIGLRQMTKMLDFSLLSSSGLVKGEGVIDFLEEHLPVRWFEDLAIPLKIVATDYWNRKEIVMESGEIIPAIRASISIPGIFEPVKLNNTVMIDGGASNPLPMSIIRDECDVLIAIDVSGISQPPKKNPVPSIFNAIMGSFQIMEANINAREKKRLEPEIYVKPDLVNIQILDFHREKDILESVTGDIESFRRDLISALDLPEKKKNKRRKILTFWK